MASSRESWVDVAKGIAILLVVVAHSVTVLEHHEVVMRPWQIMNDAFTTLRMPTFFLLSGLFAARSLLKPIGHFVNTKINNFVYLYVLWSLIHFVVSYLAQASGSDPAGALLTAATLNGMLWYLPALAVFFGVARLIKNLPVLVQVLPAAVLALVFGTQLVGTGSWGLDHMAQYLVWFLIGANFGPGLRASAARSSWFRSFFLGGLWLAGGVIIFILGGAWMFIGNALLPLLAVPFAVTFAVCFGRWSASAPLEAIGRSTLPVYVMHFPVIRIITEPAVSLVPGGSLTNYLLPLLIAAVASTIPLLFTPWLNKVPGLLALPKPLRLQEAEPAQRTGVRP